MQQNLRRYLLNAAAYAALAAVLAAAFIAYLRPEFMMDLANRIILCF